MITRIGIFILVMTATLLGTPSKPNILVIVSDDQGYADAGFQGSKEIETPNLDRLAAASLRCTNGYVTHPFCSPSRAGLMTGRYQQRFGHERNPIFTPTDVTNGLPMTEKLLPQYLQSAGYATGWVGKWHLGAAPPQKPENRGFAETFGFIAGSHSYLPEETTRKSAKLTIERNGKPVEVKEHLTLAFGHAAAQFIKRHGEGPWFLYTAFNAPHVPLEPTSERLQRYAHLSSPQRQKNAAQMSLLDDAIGEMLEALDEQGQRQRTLVFFFSDNGGPLEKNGSSNAPLRGAKATMYEGGIRVPFLISWPSVLKAGVYEPPVSSIDILATSLTLAGIPMPTDKKYDSIDLMPYLTGAKSGPAHPILYWRADGKWAIRDGDWKLIRPHKGADELYNLATDLSEKEDVAATQPEVAKRLATELEAWDKELIPPLFRGAKEKGDE